jgi:hypothetical protein
MVCDVSAATAKLVLSNQSLEVILRNCCIHATKYCKVALSVQSYHVLYVLYQLCTCCDMHVCDYVCVSPCMYNCLLQCGMTHCFVLSNT